jgi:hypothetical protein
MVFCVWNAMRKRLLRLSLLLAGLGLILAGLALRFVVVPGMKIMPADFCALRVYEGTLVAMLDPATLNFYRDLPIRIERTLRVEKVAGEKALVYELAELFRQDDQSLIQSRETHYALNRRTLLAVDGLGEDWHREGFILSFPIGTKKQAYEGWNEDALQVETVHFMGEQERGGLRTYVFNTHTGPDPIRDPFLLDLLPTEIDKTTLLELMDQIPLTEGQRALAAEALPRLPDPVPLNYAYVSDLTLWVEPTTGMAIDMVKHEERLVLLGPLPVATIFEMDWRHTPETIADVAAEARPLVDQVRLFEQTLPLGAWIVGVGLMILGGVVWKVSAPGGATLPSNLEKTDPRRSKSHARDG